MLQRSPQRSPNDERRRARRREEQRRYRARKRTSGGIAYAPYDADVIELLIASDWPEPGCAGDPHEIGAAYYRAVIDAARDLARRRSGGERGS